MGYLCRWHDVPIHNKRLY